MWSQGAISLWYSGEQRVGCSWYGHRKHVCRASGTGERKKNLSSHQNVNKHPRASSHRHRRSSAVSTAVLPCQPPRPVSHIHVSGRLPQLTTKKRAWPAQKTGYSGNSALPRTCLCLFFFWGGVGLAVSTFSCDFLCRPAACAPHGMAPTQLEQSALTALTLATLITCPNDRVLVDHRHCVRLRKSAKKKTAMAVVTGDRDEAITPESDPRLRLCLG